MPNHWKHGKYKTRLQKRLGAWNKAGTERKHIGWFCSIHFIDGQEPMRAKFELGEKGKARAWLKDSLDDLVKGKARMSLRMAIERYLNSNHAKSITDNGYRYYLNAYKNIEPLKSIDIPMRELKRMQFHTVMEDLMRYCKRKNRVRSHYKQEYDLLSASINYYINMYDEDYTSPLNTFIKQTYCGTKREKKARSLELRKALTIEELHATLDYLKDNLNPSYYVAVWLQCSVGLRISEAVGMTWDDIDFERGIVSLTGQVKYTDRDGKRLKKAEKVFSVKGQPDKGGKPHAIWQLSPELKRVLLEHKEKTGSKYWICSNKAGTDAMAKDGYNKALKNSGTFNERGMTSHKLRKTVNSMTKVLEQNWGKELLRHSSERVNQIYTDELMVTLNNPVPLAMGKVLNSHSSNQPKLLLLAPAVSKILENSI